VYSQFGGDGILYLGVRQTGAGSVRSILLGGVLLWLRRSESDMSCSVIRWGVGVSIEHWWQWYMEGEVELVDGN